MLYRYFFFNDTATTEIYTLSLHDALPIYKTAAMIVGAVRAGAILAGADEKSLDMLTKYAQNIGLAFQIVDDILDIEGDEKLLGKHIGSDLENEKSTYPSLVGMEKSKMIVNDLIDDAKDRKSV